MGNFNHQGNYKCECGKEFTNSQAFNGHKSHCKIHLGETKYLENLNKFKNSFNLGPNGRLKKSKLIKEEELNKWISEKHVCEHCGKVMTEKFGSGRFCSRACANSRVLSEETKEKIGNKLKIQKRKKYCVICGSELGSKNKSGYCADCSRKLPKTEATKEKLSNIAKERGFGGFNFHKPNILYNGIKLDSSYELIVAEDLDKNSIKWERCGRFPYHINGELHYYTPDFYLPEYDIYLDPKNDFLIHNKDLFGYNGEEKINQVEIENNIKVLILNKNQLTWDIIRELIKEKS